MPNMPPIENHSELRSFLRNTTEWTFTIVMWALWIYLFLPILCLILWVIGLTHVYRTVFREDVLRQVVQLLSNMGWLVLIIFIVLRGWGLYNFYVFGKRNRRKGHAETSLMDLSQYYNLPLEEVQALQDRKEITWTVLYDELRTKEEHHNQ